jgi:pSer/pThr/pTyr-binding forkhead associated (FHA) protein
MSQTNSESAHSSDFSAPTTYTSQGEVGLAEILQTSCPARRSGQITFRSGQSYGFVFLQQGKVLHAMCGTVEGEEAVYLMLSWPAGSFTLDDDILPHKRTINLTWEQLLFEGARRADVGLNGPKSSVATITTAEPLTIRIQDSQPKLTVTRPDLPPQVVVLEQEYTHVGRAAGNEICLPYPSISNRHCIFIQSGPDIVLRDLNSSNGTYVNGELISEVVLRPGDQVQTGTVFMKFEPGVKRPKLLPTEKVEPHETVGRLKTEASTGALYYQTLKLPSAPARPVRGEGEAKVKDDSAFVKGEAPISYEHIAKPETKKGSRWPLIVTILLVLAAIAGGVYYYFFLLHPAGR